MTPTRTHLMPCDLVTRQEATDSLGLFDDDSMIPLMDRLIKAAQEAVRNHLNRPVEGDTYKSWFAGWPDDGTFLIPNVTYLPNTQVDCQYYTPNNTLATLPSDMVLLDPTTDGRVVTQAKPALSTDFGAPVVVTLNGLGSHLSRERVREAVLQAIRIMYAARTDAFDSSQTIRAVVSQLLGNATMAHLR